VRLHMLGWLLGGSRGLEGQKKVGSVALLLQVKRLEFPRVLDIGLLRANRLLRDRSRTHLFSLAISRRYLSLSCLLRVKLSAIIMI